MSRPDEQVPSLVVIRGGELPAEELAALVVALGAAADTLSAPVRPRSGWADRRAQHRRQLDHGPGRWVVSARPTRAT